MTQAADAWSAGRSSSRRRSSRPSPCSPSGSATSSRGSTTCSACPIAETVFEPRVGGHIYDRGEDGSECRWARDPGLRTAGPGRVQLGHQPALAARDRPGQHQRGRGPLHRRDARTAPASSSSTATSTGTAPGWEGRPRRRRHDQGWPLYLDRYAALFTTRAECRRSSRAPRSTGRPPRSSPTPPTAAARSPAAALRSADAAERSSAAPARIWSAAAGRHAVGTLDTGGDHVGELDVQQLEDLAEQVQQRLVGAGVDRLLDRLARLLQVHLLVTSPASSALSRRSPRVSAGTRIPRGPAPAGAGAQRCHHGHGLRRPGPPPAGRRHRRVCRAPPR